MKTKLFAANFIPILAQTSGVVGGAFAAVITLLLLFSVWHWNLLSAVVPAVIPLGLALLYALAFRQGKPSGYDIDLFELWLKGPGFGPEILRVKPPPLFSSSDD